MLRRTMRPGYPGETLRRASDESVATLHEESCRPQRFGEFDFDTRRVATFEVLQVQRRTAQHFETTPQHAAGRSDTSLVLIEALMRTVVTHSDIDRMGLIATIAVIKQHEIDVRARTR